jgi:hypothetical protein
VREGKRVARYNPNAVVQTSATNSGNEYRASVDHATVTPSHPTSAKSAMVDRRRRNSPLRVRPTMNSAGS